MIKKILLITTITSFFLGCTTNESTQEMPTSGLEDLSPHKTIVLTVHGLSCPLCANNLDGQLKRVRGVENATINLKNGAVTVTLAPGHSVSRSDIAKAVKDAGFTLKKIEAIE